MAVYEPVSAERKAEMLLHLLMLSHSLHRKGLDSAREANGALSPDLITNIRRFDYTPSPRQIYAISQNLNLTIGGAFKLFGYSLESLRQLDFLLNGARTRLIETYPFYRDRLVDVPDILGDATAFNQNSFIADMVRSWRHGVPIRAIRGHHWRSQRLLYGQIGTNDQMAFPSIPPGSIVAISEAADSERQHPDPNCFYFLQRRSGYSCCRCLVDRGRLFLITHGQKVDIPQDFAYPDEARIVGRVIFFAVRLPIAKPEPVVTESIESNAPMLLPWEHASFASLLATEKERFGVTEARLAELTPVLKEQLGVGLSSRTLRRYEHDVNGLPRTAALLAATAVLSLRFSDVLRLLQFWSPAVNQFSLKTLMAAKETEKLSPSFNPPSAPEPAAQWVEQLKEWGEWPSLLSMTFPNLSIQPHNLLRLTPHTRSRGLSPLIRSGSIVAVDDRDVSPPRNGIEEKHVWNQPIFALRHDGEILCGYLESSETHLAMQPHPLAGFPRLRFRRNQVQILGRVIAVASPM